LVYFVAMPVVPVTILDQREAGPREGLIELLQRQTRRVDVALVLDDGTRAEACLTPPEAEWLELGEGQIVWVDVLPVLPCSETPVRVAVPVGA
jgi:hypothetical protein